MTLRETLHQEALDHLQKSREAIEMLMSANGDWTAATMLMYDFNSLEKSVREFGRCQLLLESSR